MIISLIINLLAVVSVFSTLFFGIMGISLAGFENTEKNIGHEETIGGFKYKKIRSKFYRITHGNNNIMNSATKIPAIIIFMLFLIILILAFLINIIKSS